MMDLGWSPKTPVELLDQRQEVQVPSVEEHLSLQQSIFHDVQASYAAPREQQRSRLESKFTEPAYQVGDSVMIKTSAFKDHYTKARPSSKLSAKSIGPFKILSLVRKNAIRLDLPPTMKVHPVINVSHTSPFHKQPSDIGAARQVPPSPTIIHLGEEYEIEQVLQHRKKGRGHQFLVHWKGY